MTTCLLVIDDGRADYLFRALNSVKRNLPAFEHTVTVMDIGHKLGFSGAVQEGWRQVLQTGADHVFHLEGDFAINQPVELERMIAVLERMPHLTQMSLLRQAWNREEKAAGGIVHQAPDEYTERTDGDDTWTETQRFIFTTNPSVYSTQLCRRGWPDEQHSEGVFGGVLRRERPDARCGIWGAKWDPPRVTHLGAHRTGWGY